MPPREIKNMEELGIVLTEAETERDALKATVKTLEDQAEKDKADREAEKAEREKRDELYLEKLKEITVFAKTKGSWKEQPTQEALDYKCGTLMQALYNKDTKRLVNMGCSSIRELPSPDPAGWIGKQSVRFNHDAFITKDENGNIIEKAGLDASPLTGDDSVGTYYGSYVVPVEYVAEMNRIALQASRMASIIRTRPMVGITAYLPRTTDELAFTAQTNQDTDFTVDRFVLGRATLTALTYAAWIPVVEQFLEDSLVEIGSLFNQMFGEAWGKKIDTLALSDSTYGALNTTSINETVMGTGNPAFSDITPDDLGDLIADLDSSTKRAGAKFYMHTTVWDYIRKLKDAQGNYLGGPIGVAMPAMLFGYPVVLTDGMPDSGDSAASTSFVAFGNPQHITYGRRVGYEFKIFDQTQSAMEAGQIFFRVRTRAAMVLVLPTAWTKLTTSAT